MEKNCTETINFYFVMKIVAVILALGVASILLSDIGIDKAKGLRSWFALFSNKLWNKGSCGRLAELFVKF